LDIEKRIADIQEYINGMKTLSDAALSAEQKAKFTTYWGFAMMLRELFELHLPEKTQEEIEKEKQRAETVD